jgi:acyl-CoA thioester hydrolase
MLYFRLSLQEIPMDELLIEYPVVVEFPVAWGEMDALLHVNNVTYFRYFENARLAYFKEMQYMEYMEKTGIGPILAHQQCRYRFPLTYPDVISVGAKVADMEADRFLMKYRVVSHRFQKIAAEGDGLLVSFDYRNNSKIALPDVLREAIQNIESRIA